MLSKRMPQRLDEDRSKSCKIKRMSEAQEGSVNMRMHTMEYKTIVMHNGRRRNEDQRINGEEKKRTKYCMVAKEKEKKSIASKY